MEVFRRPAVKAAVVRQQVVELLESHLEARHVESGRSRGLHLLVVFILHTRRLEVEPSTQRKEGSECGGQVSVYCSDGGRKTPPLSARFK